ncbi:AAA family ATPase [Thioalkalivibrio sp. AKL8]|uniref:AAA family ATPase n=1 Tax=Thioalkalivibrio sp. AKL8 TaxID=1158156 RepID=UPI00036761CE|nr:AAA family ATPase [Thioalkalivibrio sp. AKL8]
MAAVACLDPKHTDDMAEMDALIRLWCLRVLHDLQFHTHVSLSDVTPSLLAACGLEGEEAPEGSDVQREAGTERRIQDLLDRGVGEDFPEPMRTNLERLGKRLYLSPVEVRLLGALALIQLSGDLYEALDAYLDRRSGRGFCILGRLLGIPTREIRDALDESGRLFETGLVCAFGPSLGRANELQFQLRGRMHEELSKDVAEVEDLLRWFYTRAPAPEITVSDIPHLEDELHRLVRIIRESQQRGGKAVNILLYGGPGTGKTEFVRLLAQELGTSLVEVVHCEPDGEPIGPLQRLRRWSLAQNLYGQDRNALLLFDDMDDVFTMSGDQGPQVWSRGGVKVGKAWINSRLEASVVPSIWVANSTVQIESAYLRRFTYVREFRSPGPETRRLMVRRCFEGVPISAEFEDCLSHHRAVTPAMMRQVAALGCMGASGSNIATTESFLREQIDQHLGVQGFAAVPKAPPETLPWKRDALEASTDLEELFEGLQRSGRGRLLLHGPPGTGKTELVRALAQELDAPLILKRASDLLGQFLGQTEANIAEMFEHARESRAVLFLDEADSFLADREGARNRWEVTQTNELLTRMEEFQGIFVCATNAFDRLDAAVMRRFDAKIELQYPSAERRWALFLNLLEALTLAVPDSGHTRYLRQRIGRLENLAPGDFAMLFRCACNLGHRFEPEMLVDALERESASKGRVEGRKSGFL